MIERSEAALSVLVESAGVSHLIRGGAVMRIKTWITSSSRLIYHLRDIRNVPPHDGRRTGWGVRRPTAVGNAMIETSGSEVTE
jgi:hypothetical protein